jgi:hypothetical protein
MTWISLREASQREGEVDGTEGGGDGWKLSSCLDRVRSISDACGEKTWYHLLFSMDRHAVRAAASSPECPAQWRTHKVQSRLRVPELELVSSIKRLHLLSSLRLILYSALCVVYQKYTEDIISRYSAAHKLHHEIPPDSPCQSWETHKELRGLSPRANCIDRATAACRQN